MKKIYIIILQVLFLIFNGRVVTQAQQCFDFYRPTPNGTNVKACEGGGHSPFEIQQADIQSRTYAIEVLEGGTDSYNCHAYAWHVSEGGDKVWINNMNNEAHNVDNYWLDNSYFEVPFLSGVANLKVFYGSTYFGNDHSAVTTTDPNVFISKMGCGALVKHYKNNSPYDHSNLKYYIRTPSISGPTSVCDQATYTVENLPPGATIRWIIKEGLNRGFSISPQGVLSASVQTAIYGAPIVIQAAIEYPGTPEIKLTKSISTMPEKISFSVNATYMSGNYVSPQLLHVTISGVSHDICPPGQYRYMVNGHPAVGYENGMTVDLSSSEIRSDFYLALQDYPPDFISSGELELKILFTPRNPNSQSVSGTNRCTIANMRRSFTLSPNPATDEVTLQLMETDEVSGLSVLSTGRSPYEIQLWSGMTMLRSFRTNEPTFQIPMAGLPAGLYFVRVVKDGQTYTQKLIKK